MQGHSPEPSCPCGQTLALPACPHVSRFCVVRIHSRSKTHRRTQMTQINESTRTELQSATTERKSRGRRQKGNGAAALNRVAEAAEATTHGVSKMNTQATGTEI